MRKLNVILFKNDTENKQYSNIVCEKLSRSNLAPDQEFCGIWGEIQFNKEECIKGISSTINFALNSGKTDVYFGCAEKDYSDIISYIDTEKCEVNILTCDGI